MTSNYDPMVGSKLLSSLRVVDLKEELEKRGLSKSGRKEDLAERLKQYIWNNERVMEPVVAPPPTAATTATQDELENISLQEKQMLAEKNPFLRDYFASQQQLFQQQTVAKKMLLEEEARRESESETEQPEVPKEEVRRQEVPQARAPVQPVKEIIVPEEKKEVVAPPPEVKVASKERVEESISADAPQLEQKVVVTSQKEVVSEAAQQESESESEPESPEITKETKQQMPKSKSSDVQIPEDTPQESESESESESSEALKEEREEEEVATPTPPESDQKQIAENKKSERVEEKEIVLEVSHEESESEPESESPEPLKEEEHEQETTTPESAEHQEEVKETKEIEKIPETIVPAAKEKRVVSVSASIVEEEEEILDYGEEDKLQSEPPKFDWVRRVLNVRNKHTGKPRAVWKREGHDKPVENINTDYIMQWFSEVRLPPAGDFCLNKEEKDEKSMEPEDNDIMLTRTFSVDSDTNGLYAGNEPMENITITRKVNLIPLMSTSVQNEENGDNYLSPPRNAPSELILVSNLTRPFTLIQLKELLQRTGNLEDLWVDKIKSKCIAKYEKEEEAFETRAALHGVKWPFSNPKALHVDYTTPERLAEYKTLEAGDIKPLMAEQPMINENIPMREWDLGKRGKSRSPKRRRSRSNSAGRDRDRKRPRRSSSPRHRHSRSRSPRQDRRLRGDAKDHEQPLGKALDELFRKTVATPSIYWLPLTPGQIAEKEEVRRQRMLERERRLAEINKMRHH